MEKDKQIVFDDDVVTDFKIQNNSDINIKINFPQLVKGTLSTHYEYIIEIQENNETFKIKRRYKDIYLMWEKLLSMYIGIYIPKPHFKEKNKNQMFLMERTKYLGYFFNYIIERPFIYYSEIFQLFVKSQSNNLNKLLKSFKNLPVIELYKYNNNLFKKYFEKDYMDSLELTKQENSLKLWVNKIKDNIKYFINFRTTLIDFCKMVNDCENYINNCNIMKFFIINQRDKEKKEEIDNLLKEYNTISNLSYIRNIIRKIMFLLADFENFLLIVNDINNLKKKYKATISNSLENNEKIKRLSLKKMDSKSLFSSKTNKQKLKEMEDTQIKKKEEIEAYENIIKVWIEKLIKEELPILKKFKEKKFYFLVKKFITNRKKLIDLETEIWESNNI